MISNVVKRPLSRAVSAAFSFLSNENKMRIVCRLAQESGITALGVIGEYGQIIGAPNDRAILRNYALTKTWAKRTNDLLISFFKDEGGNYIDVGANIGLTTIPVAQNANVSCLAIEPEPINFNNLSANIAMNCHHNNVELRRMAIYIHSTTLKLEIAPENLGDHRLRTNESIGLQQEHERPVISVETKPLDEIAKDRRGRLAVKIDTQGAEPFVIASGHETLGRAGLIILEFSPYHMTRLQANAGEIIAFLRNNFKTLRTAMSEHDSISPGLPTNDVCNQLESFAITHAKDPHVYMDVIAQR